MNRRKLGQEYEEVVAQVLTKHGYQIIERNFRGRRGEIDLIAMEMGILVFIEVKYRSSTAVGMPEEAVDQRKQKTICRMADEYRRRHPEYDKYPIRFDVAAILGNRLKVYKNAFGYQWSKR